MVRASKSILGENILAESSPLGAESGAGKFPRVWSLWDIMKQFHASEMFAAYRDLRQLVCDCEALTEFGGSPEAGFLDRAQRSLDEAKTVCDEAGFSRAVDTIQKALSEIDTYCVKTEFVGIRQECNRAADAIDDEVGERLFILISPKYVNLVNYPATFSDRVFSKFSNALPDLVAAGNCLAVEEGTAAVFHLMRGVEYGLRALCAHMGLRKAKQRKKSGVTKYTPVSYVDWETMLNQLHPLIDKRIDKIKRGPIKQREQEFYIPILQDIKGFKDAFRNHVMHSRRTYSPARAEEITEHVRRFMDKLSERISQDAAI